MPKNQLLRDRQKANRGTTEEQVEIEIHPNDAGLVISTFQVATALVLVSLNSAYTRDLLFYSVFERNLISLLIAMFDVVIIGFSLPLFLASFKAGRAQRDTKVIVFFVTSNLVALNVSFATFFVVCGMGGGCEGGTIGDGLYLSVMTMATVGYGDCWPTPGWSRVATMTEATTGYAVLGVLISSISFMMDKIDE